MKLALVFAATIAATGISALALTAQAAPNSEIIKSTLEAQPYCGTFVKFDDTNVYLANGSYRNGLEEPRYPIPGKMRVAPLNGDEAFDLDTKDGAIDLITEGDTAYVLTYSAIEEWNLATRERVAMYDTYNIPGPLQYMQHASAFARYKDKIIISHGRLGVSIFNLKTKRLDDQYRLVQWQNPIESMATGVTVQGNLAYVLMDSFSLSKPEDHISIFRGMIVINMDTGKVQYELGGMDPGADAIVSDSKKIIVSFYGQPIWKYALSTLKGKSLPEPENRVWRYPVGGHPIGIPAMDDKYYYTCYSKAPSYPGENHGWYKKKPLALDRRVMMLD